MDAGTTWLVCIAIGLLLGAASSLATRRAGVRAGIAVGVAAAVAGLVVIVSLDALFPVLGAMIAFAVTASLLDPRPKGLLN